MEETEQRTQRVVIVDPHEIVRIGLRRALELVGAEVVAEVSDLAELFAIAERFDFDTVVYDIDVFGAVTCSKGSGAIRWIGLTDTGGMLDLIAPGGTRVLSKRMAAAEIAARVGLPPGEGERTPWMLGARERLVLLHVADGRTNQEIADTLGVSLGSVQATLRRLYRHTGARSRHELAMTTTFRMSPVSRWSLDPGPSAPGASYSLREQ